VRTGPQARWGDETGAPMTVDADTESQLRALLEEYAED
jgi:hypothetical protein